MGIAVFSMQVACLLESLPVGWCSIITKSLAHKIIVCRVEVYHASGNKSVGVKSVQCEYRQPQKTPPSPPTSTSLARYIPTEKMWSDISRRLWIRRSPGGIHQVSAWRMDPRITSFALFHPPQLRVCNFTWQARRGKKYTPDSMDIGHSCHLTWGMPAHPTRGVRGGKLFGKSTGPFDFDGWAWMVWSIWTITVIKWSSNWILHPVTVYLG